MDGHAAAEPAQTDGRRHAAIGATQLLPVWSPPPIDRTLGAGDLHLWLIELLAADSELRQAESLLSAAELDRARRFHFERDARSYTVAHAALRSILASYLAVPPRYLDFVLNPYGKPSLNTAHGSTDSARQADLTFNLSHSGELALVAVTAGRRVGVDIEQVRPEYASGQIAERFFSPAEARVLASLPLAERPAAFFRCWTRKEAFVKARGEGLTLSLDSFDVSLRAADPPALLRVAGDREEAGRWSVDAVPIDARGDYEAAVVVEGRVGRNSAWLYMKNS